MSKYLESNKQHALPPEQALARRTRNGLPLFELEAGPTSICELTPEGGTELRPTGKWSYRVASDGGSFASDAEDLPDTWLTAYIGHHERRARMSRRHT
jgi:hypothetical protein